VSGLQAEMHEGTHETVHDGMHTALAAEGVGAEVVTCE